MLESPLGACEMSHPAPGFLTLTPPKDGILEWISQLQSIRKETVLAVNLKRDIQKSFALLYDFVDFLIVDTGWEGGTPEVPEITVLLDELLSLRLCYERYTRVLVRITDGLTMQEIGPFLDYCRLSGIDGVVIHGVKRFEFAQDHTQGRLPLILSTDSPQEALDFCSRGIPVETSLGHIQRIKIIKSLNK
ncbi:MAG: hypothetical protein IJU21_00865 [Bacteroidales bacterium]|nr:hypothetical protein [Bacteroidales bacterium]